MMVMMEVFLTCILIEHDFNTLSVNIFGVQFFSFLVILSYLSNILLFLYHLKFLFSRLFFNLGEEDISKQDRKTRNHKAKERHTGLHKN